MILCFVVRSVASELRSSSSSSGGEDKVPVYVLHILFSYGYKCTEHVGIILA
jgi:hypothetical protein